MCHVEPSMAIEMTSKQMRLERKNAIDNARLFVGIIIGYSFFNFLAVSARCLTSSHCFTCTYLLDDENNLTVN